MRFCFRNDSETVNSVSSGYVAQVYLEPCQNGYQLSAVNYFPKKSSIVDIWQGPKYAPNEFVYLFSQTRKLWNYQMSW